MVTRLAPFPDRGHAPDDPRSPSSTGTDVRAADGHRSARRSRLAALDGLRLIAALAVLSFHYTALGGIYWGQPVPFPTMAKLSVYGFLGVNLFFIISGFVICMSSWGRRLSDFFASRVSRLFPAYWVAVLTTAAVLVLLPFSPRVEAATWLPHRFSATQVLVNLTMLQQPVGAPHVDASYWTLYRELLFYLLFAAVVWRGVTYRRTVAFCLMWTVLSVLVVGMPNSLLAYVVDPLYSPYFVAGVAMYLMYRYRPTILLAAIVVVSWILALYYLGNELAGGTYLTLPLHRSIAYGIVTASFLAVLAVALGWLDRIQWRWLTVAGALTYPLYLLHGVAGYHVIAWFAPVSNKYVLLAAVTVGMLVAAWLLHRLVERRGTPWLRRRMLAALAEAANAPTAQEPTVRQVIHPGPLPAASTVELKADDGRLTSAGPGFGG